ncbi:MAG: hypothetical protein BZY88_11470 [SAR202 cluster bacterium Io17-Chloro-G9]|nr:MAG: hypothetical protein BZY88_11470 [SAR202 cluster bacterium Io17-Chloro-G9]
MEYRPTDDRPWIFYYDGNCRFCCSVVVWMSRLDITHRVTWTAFQLLEEPPAGLTWDDLDRSAYLADRAETRRYEGFYAFRRLTIVLPLLTPFAAIAWLPGMSSVGVAAYRWVARNRYRISQCRIPRTPDVPEQ